MPNSTVTVTPWQQEASERYVAKPGYRSGAKRECEIGVLVLYKVCYIAGCQRESTPAIFVESDQH
jgi:hypothetical protein